MTELRDRKRIFLTKRTLFGVALIVMVACAAPQPGGQDASEPHAAAVDSEEVEDLREGDEGVEIPPEGSLPLSEIVASIEMAGHTAITEVEFEDGVWEVDFMVGGEAYELEIDPMTGEVLSDEPERADDD
jgi:hypothetical protein